MSSRKGRTTSPTEVVSKVIHEYDVIESADDNNEPMATSEHVPPAASGENNRNLGQNSDTEPFLPTEETSDHSQEEQSETYVCPRVNCPERIVRILFIDYKWGRGVG